MSVKHIYLRDLHFEHLHWLNLLQFHKEELQIFNYQLAEIAHRNTNKNLLDKVEQFQNQFIRQNETTDRLMQHVKQHESALAQYTQDYPVAIEHVYFRNHQNMRNELEMYEKTFAELKINLNKNLSSWM